MLSVCGTSFFDCVVLVDADDVEVGSRERVGITYRSAVPFEPYFECGEVDRDESRLSASNDYAIAELAVFVLRRESANFGNVAFLIRSRAVVERADFFGYVVERVFCLVLGVGQFLNRGYECGDTALHRGYRFELVYVVNGIVFGVCGDCRSAEFVLNEVFVYLATDDGAGVLITVNGCGVERRIFGIATRVVIVYGRRLSVEKRFGKIQRLERCGYRSVGRRNVIGNVDGVVFYHRQTVRGVFEGHRRSYRSDVSDTACNSHIVVGTYEVGRKRSRIVTFGIGGSDCNPNTVVLDFDIHALENRVYALRGLVLDLTLEGYVCPSAGFVLFEGVVRFHCGLVVVRVNGRLRACLTDSR